MREGQVGTWSNWQNQTPELQAIFRSKVAVDVSGLVGPQEFKWAFESTSTRNMHVDFPEMSWCSGEPEPISLECSPLPPSMYQPEDAFQLSGGASWYNDHVRSGNLNQNSEVVMTKLTEVPAGVESFEFYWDYAMGYCGGLGSDGPPVVLKLLIGGEEVLRAWNPSSSTGTMRWGIAAASAA